MVFCWGAWVCSANKCGLYCRWLVREGCVCCTVVGCGGDSCRKRRSFGVRRVLCFRRGVGSKALGWFFLSVVLSELGCVRRAVVIRCLGLCSRGQTALFCVGSVVFVIQSPLSPVRRVSCRVSSGGSPGERLWWRFWAWISCGVSLRFARWSRELCSVALGVCAESCRRACGKWRCFCVILSAPVERCFLLR